MATLALKTDTAHLLFQSGRMDVVLGRRGSGKTWMLRHLAGLLTAPDVHVYAGGVEVTGLTPTQRRVRYVAPGGIVYPGCSVLDNLLAGTSSADAEARARDVAARFDLTDVLDTRADQATPDVRQRVALAKAAASAAQAVLLDEPFAAFDSLARNRVRDMVRSSLVSRDRIVVVATSCPFEAARLGGGLHVVHDNAMLQRGTIKSVVSEPASELVARIVHAPALAVWPVMLVKDSTLGRVVQIGDRLLVPAPTVWDALALGPYRLGIPAHHVHESRRHAADLELRAEVVQVDAAHGQMAVTARVDRFELTYHSRARPTPRQSVALFVGLQDLLVFSPHGKTLRLANQEAVAHGAH